jgi:preprotein translocase subunit YajC
MPGDAPDLLLAADAAAQGGGFDWFGLALMVVAMGAIMYFLVIRPQQREKAERESLMNSLSKGDEVITSGGLHGRIVSVDDTVVRMDIGGKATVTVEKDAVTRKASDDASSDKKKQG